MTNLSIATQLQIALVAVNELSRQGRTVITIVSGLLDIPAILVDAPPEGVTGATTHRQSDGAGGVVRRCSALAWGARIDWQVHERAAEVANG